MARHGDWDIIMQLFMSKQEVPMSEQWQEESCCSSFPPSERPIRAIGKLQFLSEHQEIRDYVIGTCSKKMVPSLGMGAQADTLAKNLKKTLSLEMEDNEEQE